MVSVNYKRLGFSLGLPLSNPIFKLSSAHSFQNPNAKSTVHQTSLQAFRNQATKDSFHSNEQHSVGRIGTPPVDWQETNKTIANYVKLQHGTSIDQLLKTIFELISSALPAGCLLAINFHVSFADLDEKKLVTWAKVGNPLHQHHAMASMSPRQQWYVTLHESRNIVLKHANMTSWSRELRTCTCDALWKKGGNCQTPQRFSIIYCCLSEHSKCRKSDTHTGKAASDKWF